MNNTICIRNAGQYLIVVLRSLDRLPLMLPSQNVRQRLSRSITLWFCPRLANLCQVMLDHYVNTVFGRSMEMDAVSESWAAAAGEELGEERPFPSSKGLVIGGSGAAFLHAWLVYLGLVATVVVVDGFGTERMIYDGVSDLRREVPLAVLCSMCVCGVWCVVLLVGLCFDFGRK